MKTSSPHITRRAPSMQQAYDVWRHALQAEYGDTAPCPFCTLLSEHEQLAQTDTMVVVRNRFPYKWFDGQLVDQHTMIVPRRHIATFSDFTHEEQQDYWHLMQQFHKDGHSIFTRSAVDDHRSVPAHIHTHLLSYKAEPPR